MTDWTPPRILSRADWLARAPQAPLARRDPSLLRGTVVHHQAARPALDANPAELMAAIQAYDFTRGYTDVAYNAAVWHDGTVLLGRDAAFRGAHTAFTKDQQDWNVTTVGVCILGDGDDPAYVTDDAWRAVLWLWALTAYTTAGKATGLWTHRETTSPTHCAGEAVQARMDGLRTWLAAGMPPVDA